MNRRTSLLSASVACALAATALGWTVHTTLPILTFQELNGAVAAYEQSLALYRATGSPQGEAMALDAERRAAAFKQACKKAGVDASEVSVIGCHGQTLYHHPRPETPFPVATIKPWSSRAIPRIESFGNARLIPRHVRPPSALRNTPPSNVPARIPCSWSTTITRIKFSIIPS